MWMKFIFVCFLLLWLNDEVIGEKRRQFRYRSAHPQSELKAFDYDYDLELPRRVSYKHQKSNPTTTERPLIRYWNNLVRNVRLPVPTITWNMTNPLVNLFNAGGEANVFETPVAELQYTTNKRRRKPSKKTEKQQKSKKKRRRPNYEYDSYLQDENEEQQQQHQHITVQPQPYYQNYNPSKVMYFYDPNTKQYYEIQPLNPIGNAQTYDSNAYYDGSDYTAQQNYQKPSGEENEAIEEPNDNSNDEDEPSQEQQHLPVNDDDDVSIVQNFEDEEDFGETKKSESNDEMLRNVLGSYMKDDHTNRQRQRSKSKQHKRKQLMKKSRPRSDFNYYFLKPWTI